MAEPIVVVVVEANSVDFEWYSIVERTIVFAIVVDPGFDGETVLETVGVHEPVERLVMIADF